MVKKDTQYWTRKASKYFTSGNLLLSLDALNRALEIEPEEPNLLFMRGATLEKLGHLDKALESVEKSLKIDPTSANSWYYKGLILYRKEEHMESLSSFQEAQRLDSTNVQNLVHMALVLAVLGRSKEAIESWEKARKYEPEYTEHWLRGLHFMTEGKSKKANIEFEKAKMVLLRKYVKKKDLE